MKFEEGDEVYYSQITDEWYEDFEAVMKDHKRLGYSEAQIKQANEELTIYFTTYAE